MSEDHSLPPPAPHMTPDAFRRHAAAVVEWVARYMEDVATYPVRAQVLPGDIRNRLPASPPEHGEPFDAVLRDLDTIVLPGITHWQSPNFFAFFPTSASGPSILGELVSAALGVQGMSWETSPACTEIETHVLDWMVEALALPERFRSTSTGGGVIQDTASSATLCAVVAARERATDGAGNRTGVGDALVAYASTQAHSSVEKAIRIAGIGSERLRLIEVDETYAMRPDALEQAIADDLEAGLTPFFVNATLGTTSSTAIDPLAEIGALTSEHGIWLHADAAMIGTAAVCPEFRYPHDGMERADSYCVNPHKWMLTNVDCDLFYVADRHALIEALSILPEYLRNRASASGAVIDYRDWHVPLGRRFRALKLWFVLRHYGLEGIRAHVRRHVALAQTFAGWVDADPDFEIAAPAPFNLVCFRHRGGDETNQRVLDTLNDSGRLYLTHTRLDDRLTLRLCVGQASTDEPHVRAAWEAIRDTARHVA